ncbi:c-type cytochrome [Novosphingobium sp. M1R2S20]|uniref:Cytochrome c n=1 Tax=Novosphingobium rhizovicinum TaxID=3228928 RepID=A0ABV3R9Z9_9SPHN
MMSKVSWRSVLIGAAGMLSLLLAFALIVVLTGAYNVAADDRHETPVGWALTTTMRNSVQNRASEIRVPAMTPAMVAAGAAPYKAMCQHCHGGVGASREKWAHGMRPMPPALASAAAEWKPEEVFWIVKHGVKMSGMPSFGGSHDERALWNIAAFVKALPQMTPEQYKDFASAESEAAAGHSH